MKALFFIQAMGFGGSERVLANLANFCTEHGIRVRIVRVTDRPVAYPLDPEVECAALLPEEQGLRLPAKFARTLRIFRGVRREMRAFKPDVMLSMGITTNLLALCAAFFSRTPVIVSERNDPARHRGGAVHAFLRNLLYRHADGIVFQTGHAMEYFSPSIRRKGTVIPNAVPTDALPSPHRGPRTPRVVAAGRLEPSKNHALLIGAFARIADAFPEVTLTIYGEGRLRQDLIHLIESHRLTDRVHLPGASSDLWNEIRDAALFVLSSSYEGIPNALLEAMALEIPCVSTAFAGGGASLLLQNGQNGLLVPVGDEGALADAMARLLAHPDEAAQMGREGGRVRERFSPNSIYARWVALIHRVRAERC